MNKHSPVATNVDETPWTAAWMQTASGKAWNLIAPKSSDVHWPDVAHHLSQINRFNGATKVPYSVAEHCCHAHDVAAKANMAPRVKLLALLHDAHEAFVGDHTTPLQVALDMVSDGAGSKALKALKARTDAVLFERAGLSGLTPEEVRYVKTVDITLLMQERDTLLGQPPRPWGDLESVLPADVRLPCWTSAVARWEWLQRLQMCGVAL